jgi:hypothetical protein
MHPVGQTANLSKEGLENPGLPRFHAAATKEHPQGTEGHPTTRSVLQQHVDFFDRDKDGIITVSIASKSLLNLVCRCQRLLLVSGR